MCATNSEAPAMDKTTWIADGRHVTAGDRYVGYLQDFSDEDLLLTLRAVNSYSATQAALKALVEAAKGWQSLTQHSRGLDGYHRNGDIAEWSEFSELLQETEEALRLAQEVGK